MVTEARRLNLLGAHADFLRDLPDSLTPEIRARLTQISHDLKKTQQFVVDRDAGPSADLVSENTRLAGELEKGANYLAAAAAAHNQFVEKTKAMRDENPKLRGDLKEAEKKIGRLEADLATSRADLEAARTEIAALKKSEVKSG